MSRSVLFMSRYRVTRLHHMSFLYAHLTIAVTAFLHASQSGPSSRSLPSHLHRCYLLCNIRVFSSHYMAIPRKAFLGDISGDCLDHCMSFFLLLLLECHRLLNTLGQPDWHTFSRPRCALAPSTSHSSAALAIPFHRPTALLLAFLVIFILQDGVCQSSLCEHMPCNCPGYICIRSVYAWCNAPATVFCSNGFQTFYAYM